MGGELRYEDKGDIYMGFFGKRDEKLGKYSPVNAEFFRDGDTGTDNLANNHFQHVEFYHLPSEYYVYFKAFLTSFSDKYSSQWKKTPVYGRMDDIATFTKTSRIISFGLQTVAASVQEAEQNMIRISLLLQMLYPEFEDGALVDKAAKGQAGTGGKVQSTIKGSPLFKIKFLNWIKGASSESIKKETAQPFGYGAQDSGLMGYLDGITVNPDLDAGVFQAGMSIFPKVVDLSFNFNVIHEHALGWKKSSSDRYSADPQTANFPYGVNTKFNEKRQDKQDPGGAMAKGKAKAQKNLYKAQKNLIIGKD